MGLKAWDLAGPLALARLSIGGYPANVPQESQMKSRLILTGILMAAFNATASAQDLRQECRRTFDSHPGSIVLDTRVPDLGEFLGVSGFLSCVWQLKETATDTASKVREVKLSQLRFQVDGVNILYSEWIHLVQPDGTLKELGNVVYLFDKVGAMGWIIADVGSRAFETPLNFNVNELPSGLRPTYVKLAAVRQRQAQVRAAAMNAFRPGLTEKYMQADLP